MQLHQRSVETFPPTKQRSPPDSLSEDAIHSLPSGLLTSPQYYYTDYESYPLQPRQVQLTLCPNFYKPLEFFTPELSDDEIALFQDFLSTVQVGELYIPAETMDNLIRASKIKQKKERSNRERRSGELPKSSLSIFTEKNRLDPSEVEEHLNRSFSQANRPLKLKSSLRMTRTVSMGPRAVSFSPDALAPSPVTFLRSPEPAPGAQRPEQNLPHKTSSANPTMSPKSPDFVRDLASPEGNTQKPNEPQTLFQPSPAVPYSVAHGRNNPFPPKKDNAAGLYSPPRQSFVPTNGPGRLAPNAIKNESRTANASVKPEDFQKPS